MQYILIGFSHDDSFRVFVFEGIADDHTRTRFAVRADLALIGSYGIRVQELPMLCRRFLEDREEGRPGRALTFGENEMRLHASICAAEREAAQKRKAPRRPFFGVSAPR